MTSGINVMNIWKLIVRVWKDKKTEKDSVFVIFTENIVHAICHTKKGTTRSHRNPHPSADCGSGLSIIILPLF